MYFFIPSSPASPKKHFSVENWKAYYCEMCLVEMDIYKGGKTSMLILLH